MSTTPFKSRGLILVLLALTGGFSTSGCSLADNSFRTLILEPIHFSNSLDRWRTRSRAKELEKAAWRDYTCQHAGMQFSADFERGFDKGFVEIFVYGGSPAPPPIPPREYWGIQDRMEPGGAADWLAGYQEGAMTAHNTVGHPVVITPCPPMLVVHQPERIPTPNPVPIPDNP